MDRTYGASEQIIKAAIVQCQLDRSLDENIEVLERLIRDASDAGAHIILTPELIDGPYFCKSQEEVHFARAMPISEHKAVERYQSLAKELGVVLPVSIFEKDGPHYFNTLVMIDAGGEVLGRYRKSHIPDGPGYQEKFYFRPGSEAPRAWQTKYGRIGAGICWDQWYPEVARVMALDGADMLLYPTAIGAEPQDPSLDTAARWQRAMQGHAVSNVVPVLASNRIGDEDGQSFYGCSFIAGTDGVIVDQMGRNETGFRMAEFNISENDKERAAWGFFRDRRPDLYGKITAPN